MVRSYRWRLNGAVIPRTSLVEMLGASLTPTALKSTGGLLFQFCLCDGEANVGVVPRVEHGARRYHYEIELPCDPRLILIGSATPYLEFSILFRNRDISDADRTVYRAEYSCLATLLLDVTRRREGAGSRDRRVDDVTGRLLVDAGVCTKPPLHIRDLLAAVNMPS